MEDNFKNHHHITLPHFSMLVPFLQKGMLKTASFSLVFPICYYLSATAVRGDKAILEPVSDTAGVWT